ncbi:MAG TPA: hypothetical protein VMZ74_05430 [Ramlibacter sp.]|nr:hypothetical protein [Ramlibacter sp.]
MAQDEDRTASLMTPAKLAQAGSRPKAPVSPAAWLDKMASDAGHQHVRRLAELRADLQAQATKRDFSPLAKDLDAVAAALPQLDFGLLQQKGGLLARLSGKNKNTFVEFASQFDAIDETLDQLAKQGKSLQAKLAEQAAITDRTLVEFEVEFRGLEKIIDQGARWLQDMRNQLKTREAEAIDDAARAQVRQDAQRCEVLVSRLKQLRALSTAAHECQQQAQATAARRASIAQSLQGTVAERAKQWRTRVTPLANAARDGESPGLSLEAPMDCHRDLQLCIKDAIADCAQMQSHEKELAGTFEGLAPHLQAAG